MHEPLRHIERLAALVLRATLLTLRLLVLLRGQGIVMDGLVGDEAIGKKPEKDGDEEETAHVEGPYQNLARMAREVFKGKPMKMKAYTSFALSAADSSDSSRARSSTTRKVRAAR